jgi:hypothetical protein
MSAAGAGTSAAGAGTSAAGTGSSAAGAGAERLAPVYRHGDVVIVRPLRSQFWLAQLLEPIIEVSPGRFNVDRPRCRYFVPTAELAAYTHAIKWWQGRGAQLRLADEAAAIARSSESDGVHFSFEQTDHVTRSTICGRLEPSCLSERLFFNHELISFAISEHEFELARELVSGIAITEAEAGPSLEDAWRMWRLQRGRPHKLRPRRIRLRLRRRRTWLALHRSERTERHGRWCNRRLPALVRIC